MKKLSFILAMVLGTGMAIAQVNTVNLTQSGGNQEAVIGQTGTNTANVTQSTDDGMKQRTNVSQSGSNTINITQTELGAPTNGVSIPVQTADVFQDGTANSGIITQLETGSGDKYLSSAKLDQIGQNNFSDQKTNAPQSNSGMKVIGYQNGTWNKIYQDITSGWTEYFKADQFGYDNKAVQTGNGSFADGTIHQNGSSNNATQLLAGQNNGYDRTGMLINQVGGNNEAVQDFWGSGYNAGHSGETYQLGSDNKSFQSGQGHHFTSIVTQNGDANFADLKQNGTAQPLLYDNSVQLYQYLNNNHAWITQELGSSNNIKLLQRGSGNVILKQSGDQNVIQGLTTYGSFDATWAKFNGSNLNVLQSGTKNDLQIEAEGIVAIAQNGIENLIKLSKTGVGTANITQTGNYNKVAQFDDVFGSTVVGDAAIFNGATLDIIQKDGNNNLLNLNSTSVGADVDVIQIGSDNRASVIQH